MPYNLSSPNGIVERCALSSLDRWFGRELAQLSSKPEKRVLAEVAANLDSFVRWADKPLLLWSSCNRVPEPGQRQKYHSYPDHIRALAERRRIRLDTRPNGPAIAAFLLGRGDRPERFGSSHCWSIHHLYSGKFPYVGYQETTHAVKEYHHFTQSAGIVAVHPVADSLCDEFPFFAWLLRAKAFMRFGYDPDGVFGLKIDRYGFASGHSCRIIKEAA